MHEVAAMQGAVQTILEQVRAAGGSRVTTVELILGASGHFTEEAARQHFAVLTTGTPAEGATLEIFWLPATFQCFSCLHRFESCSPAEQVTCPRCGDLALEIEHQDPCYVGAIDVTIDDAGDTGKLIVAEETMPEIHVLSNECCAGTPQQALSC